MPKSKLKLSARAASSKGLPRHPALQNPDCMLKCRMGAEDEMRLPDSYAEPTAATNLNDDYTVTANADGDFCVLEHTALGRYVYTVTAGTVGAEPAKTTTNKYSSFTTAARQARLICMKVQVMYIGAEMASAGYITMTRKSNKLDVTAQTISSLHNNGDKQFRAQDGCTFFVGYKQEPRFEYPTVATFMDATFSNLCIVGSGIPAGANVKVRVVRFMEFIPVEGDLMEGSTKTEPLDRAATDVFSQMSTTTLSAYTGPEQPTYIQRLKEAANAAYHMAQPVLTNYVVPKARAYLQDALTTSMSMLPLLL